MARGKYKAARRQLGDGSDDNDQVNDYDGEYDGTDAEYDEDATDYDEADYEGAGGEGEDAAYEYDEDETYEYDEDDEDAGGEEVAAEETFTPPTALSAIKQVFSPRGPRQRAQPATGTPEDGQRINFVNKTERLIGFTFSGMLIALAVLTYFQFHNYVDKKNLHNQALYRNAAVPNLIFIGAIGLCLVLATLSKRRAAVGFTMLFAGLAAGRAIPLVGLVYLGVGLWLIFRSMKRSPRSRAARARAEARNAQGAKATGGATRAGYRGAAATSPARATSTTSTSSASSRQIGRNRRLEEDTSRKAPPPSKRYTPPKTSRRPPPVVAPEPEPTNRLSAWLRK
jgi:hypothetical protein